MTTIKALNLTKEFPRSPHEDSGGYVILPRMIDKCRAVIASTNGEYKYNCPLDRQFFDFTGIDADEFKAQVAAGVSDPELLAFVQQKADPHSESEICCWSFEQRQRGPLLADQKAFFEEMRRKIAPNHPRLSAWFDLLDAEEDRIK
jgi:hypothetical protein